MTRYLAHLTKGFVFVNLGITFGPLFCEYGNLIANIGHQLSLLHFWRGLHVPICTQLVISLEQQVSLTKQEDGIPDLPSYLANSLFNGLCVSTCHVSSLIYSEMLPPRWRFVTMPNLMITFFIYISDVVVDAVLNRWAGWWGGSISSVRIRLTLMILKCHADF